ncbi:MAG TPA: BatD family protein [Candidatus Limnocylindrales bacterium]|nr:BatD family protein [Candidatus Limnocylindrales bacterium]
MSLMLSQPRIDVESPVVPTAVFDPPVVRPGALAIYRLTFNALEESIDLPIEMPAPTGAKLRPGGHGQMLAMAGPTLQPRTSYNFHLRPSQPGEITMPEFVATVYGKPVTVPAARLQVMTDLPATNFAAHCLVLEVPQTNVFVGQSLPVTILFPGLVGIAMQGQAPVQLIGQGLLTDPSSLHPRFEPRPGPVPGRNVQAFLYEGIVTPISSGKLSFFAQSFVAARPTGPIAVTAPGPVPGGPAYTLLDSDPVDFEVRPIPIEGRLPGFTGAVGDFSIGTPELATNVTRVGDPVKLTVKVRGDGNLLRIVQPLAPRPRHWQVLSAGGDNLPPQIIQAQGFTTFNYTLIPLTEKARFTPAIPFSCFDPERQAYRDLTIPSIPVTIKPGVVPGDLAALMQANALSRETEKEPVLAGLAAAPGLAPGTLVPLQRQVWFALMQLAPAFGFLGLWRWDRRRRFLQQHPEIILRRRARRALRRERRALNRAAVEQDAQAFATAAVNALRIACAPHLPAVPRALVGTDVLGFLTEAERAGRKGHIIKRLFAVTDAARFDSNPGGTANLLSLKTELDALLDRFAERLV